MHADVCLEAVISEALAIWQPSPPAFPDNWGYFGVGVAIRGDPFALRLASFMIVDVVRWTFISYHAKSEFSWTVVDFGLGRLQLELGALTFLLGLESFWLDLCLAMPLTSFAEIDVQIGVAEATLALQSPCVFLGFSARIDLALWNGD